MLTKDVRPSSIVGVKRFARQLRREHGLPYHEALDRAAQAASCQNYAHARSDLDCRRRKDGPGNRVFLTMYWEDRKARTHGRETLAVWLSKPLLDVCSRAELKRARSLGWFRCVAEDHLVADTVLNSQDATRREICSAARTLGFMDETGLKPATAHAARVAKRDQAETLPRCDHVTFWTDPATNQLVMIDEPYTDPVVTDERRAWSQRQGWDLQVSKWPGMYFPYRSAMFVAARTSASFDFDALMKMIDALPEPVTEDHWEGTSVDNHDVFLSPRAITAQDRRRAKAKGTIFRTATDNTIPMRIWSPRNNRKPNAVMPLQVHQELGRAIKSLVVVGLLDIGYSVRLNLLRSELEDWMGFEHYHPNTKDFDFIGVYYDGIDDDDEYVRRAQTREGRIKILGSVRHALTSYYPDCAPLRRLLRAVDGSIAILQRANQ